MTFLLYIFTWLTPLSPAMLPLLEVVRYPISYAPGHSYNITVFIQYSWYLLSDFLGKIVVDPRVTEKGGSSILVLSDDTDVGGCGHLYQF